MSGGAKLETSGEARVPIATLFYRSLGVGYSEMQDSNTTSKITNSTKNREFNVHLHKI